MLILSLGAPSSLFISLSLVDLDNLIVHRLAVAVAVAVLIKCVSY